MTTDTSASGAKLQTDKTGSSISLHELFATLPERERRGSRARCVLLTHGSDEAVACRLSSLAATYAVVDPERHQWMPHGFAAPEEAKLGDALPILSEQRREAITAWWLAVRGHANTPNWDIASTATIGGADGLLLVEAKAHAAEVKTETDPTIMRETMRKSIPPAERQALP
jgi:hypothetical protein